MQWSEVTLYIDKPTSWSHVLVTLYTLINKLTCAISSGVVTGFDSCLRDSMTALTALLTPMRTSFGFAPLDTRENPS